MKNLILATVLIAFAAMPLQAQFLKKLKQNVENRVEQVVINKTADKAAAETDKSMENLMNLDFKNSGFAMGFEQVDPAEIPDSYDFEWNYVMSFTTAQGDMEMEYFLKKDAPYFGVYVPQNDSYMVMDHSKNMNVMYLNSGESKMLMATRIPEPTSGDLAKQEDYNEDFNFKKIGDKKILGYNCTGFQGENKDTVFTFYITTEADISFNDIYKSNNSQLPKGFDPEWIKDGKGLMMQMIMEGKKNAKENVTMTCTKLEKKPFSIQKSDYKSMTGE
ncbi:MAG TPA: DUF4412 domain-containing protein [Gillisia sp.]|nr:DUF4412 domain-containing protein [Gillisia sp.]